MAQPAGDTGGGDQSHAVIDVGASSCAVCMEALEWAAIGPCGHGDVCSGCSLHIHVFQHNRCCCICRALCRIVVVTKHDAIAAGGWPAASSRLPRSRTGGYSQFEGRVGEYWYHAGMEAFFDDERQYTAAKAAARLGPSPCGDANESPPPPPPSHTSVSNSHGRQSRRDPPDRSCVTRCEAIEALGLFLVVVVLLVVITLL